jgi:hypothetical protein
MLDRQGRGDTAVEVRLEHEQDVEGIFNILTENHPGMVDADNPGFAKTLERARRAALARTPRVSTPAAAQFSLMGMIVTIGDAHTSVGRSGSVPPIQRWPGWQVGWRGEAPVVSGTRPGASIAGARVLDCDGRTLEQWARTDVMPWDDTFLDASDLRPAMTEVLFDRGNPFRTVPRSCRLELATGRVIDHRLQWVPPVPGGAGFGPSWFSTDRAKMVEHTPAVFVIRIPSFSASRDESVEDLVRETRRRHAELANARTLVLDLRGNPGGEDRTMASLLAATVGNRPEIACVLLAPQPTGFRITRENVLALSDRSRGSQPMVSATLRIIATLMADGLDESEATGALNEDASPLLQVNVNRHQPPGRQRVVAVTDANCRSACLMFMTYLRLLPDLVHVGMPTPFEARYANPVRAELPSGRVLTYSTVVFRTRFWPEEVFMPTVPLDFGPRGAAGAFFEPAREGATQPPLAYDRGGRPDRTIERVFELIGEAPDG